MDDLAKWGWAVALGCNAVLGWAVWSLRNGFVGRAEFARLATKVELTEAEVHHLPDRDDFDRLRAEVATVRGQQDAQKELLSGIAASVRRIEDYLLATAKKG